MEIDYKSVAKSPRKKTSQQASKSAQISADSPVENIQKARNHSISPPAARRFQATLTSIESLRD
jgi:hypothetical protein